MRNLAQLLCVFIAFLFATTAQARVQISIDLTTQTMNVQASDGESYSWPISSARAGYVTPRGVYGPTSLQAMHYSRKYHHSPMPHSIFFHGGYAIHGTYAMRSLGRPASHGCVRISPVNAARLYSLVKAEGATIVISGSPPPSRSFASETHHRQRHYHHRYAYSSHHSYPVMSYVPTRHYMEPTGIFGMVLSH
ncbi:L,D-transpeptidase [Rhodoblastus sp.]|uniref:L,D-transpeptidase n=1 Tax=Rhodoblastus sp. TaxID=1962975 RepID=UPI00261BD086|nr:L,D-transpeptidase [Rhodoblastus sp.]